MHDIKRKKPWEEEEVSEDSLSQALIMQSVLCIIIIATIFFMSKTNTNRDLLIRIDYEIQKQITMDECYQGVLKIKSMIMDYVISQ